MLLLSSSIRKDAICLRITNSTVEQCQTSKWLLSLQRKLLYASCFILWHFPIVSRRGWAHQPYVGQMPISMLLMSLEREEMKRRTLIEAKSTPCLCELPFSWLKTLTVGNYSAREHQSLKLMCNHRLEPDIKKNLTIFGSHKHPCKYKCWDHCVPAVTHLCPYCFVIVLYRTNKQLKHTNQMCKTLHIFQNGNIRYLQHVSCLVPACRILFTRRNASK